MSNFSLPADHFYPINTANDLPGAIAYAFSVGAVGEAVLLRALHQGRIAHWQLLPGGSRGEFKRFAAACRNRPSVAVIPADDYRDRDPECWPAAPAAFAWAKHIVVHASGAKAEHYEDAIKTALVCKRVLFVECSARVAEKWMTLAGNAQAVLLILPSDGLHPVLPPRGSVQ